MTYQAGLATFNGPFRSYDISVFEVANKRLQVYDVKLHTRFVFVIFHFERFFSSPLERLARGKVRCIHDDIYSLSNGNFEGDIPRLVLLERPKTSSARHVDTNQVLTKP